MDISNVTIGGGDIEKEERTVQIETEVMIF